MRNYFDVKLNAEGLIPGFSLDPLDIWGGFVPPCGGTSAGEQSVNGGTYEGGHRHYGKTRVFPRPSRHGLGFVPPIWGDKALMGGLMRGYIDLMGAPNFDRLYHKLKVLLLLLILR